MTEPKVRIVSAERWYYIDKTNPDLGGYTIEQGEQGYRWMWIEKVAGDDFPGFGPWLNSQAEALRWAADDWEENGSPESAPRLAGSMRGVATRLDSVGRVR